MRVNLSGRDVHVAEHFLHLAEVGAVGEEVGGETVPQGVRADVGADAGNDGITLDEFPYAVALEGLSTVRKEHPRWFLTKLRECRSFRSGITLTTYDLEA